MSAISDITEIEKWTVRSNLEERQGKDKTDLPVANVEAGHDPSDRELNECPALYREQGECHYVIIKTGNTFCSAQFYHGHHEQSGTGAPKYQDLGDCALSLLRLQAEHERLLTNKRIHKPY